MRRIERLLGWSLCTATLLSVTWIAAVQLGIRLNVEPSVPMGAYRVVNGPVERGDTVGACLPPSLAQYALAHRIIGHGGCPSGVMPVVKIVAAVPGDRVDVTSAGIAINGQMWPMSIIRRRSCYGQPIDERLSPGRYVIGPHSLFLLGLNPCSYDARYWPAGSVTRSMVARWNPLITLPRERG